MPEKRLENVICREAGKPGPRMILGDNTNAGVSEPGENIPESDSPYVNKSKLSVFLLVSVFSQTLFSFVSRNLVSFTLSSTRHKLIS